MTPAVSHDELAADWRKRLDHVIATMREMSEQTDPLTMGQAYSKRLRELRPIDRYVALSRRGLAYPQYRVTRSTQWNEVINPWKEQHRLPLLSGGFLAELLYGDEPRIIDDLDAEGLAGDDPAAEYLRGMRSLMAIPHYDQGLGLNMAVVMRETPGAFDRESFPEQVWMSNLFGRATHNLVLSGQLREAFEAVDRELRAVAEVQESLLPSSLPEIPTLGLAAHYRMARRAGGDYYDFFELPEGRWGLLIADVSGHGPAAAVLMAVLHALAHAYPGYPTRPGRLLEHVNDHLVRRYTAGAGTFVTAFYGVYDPVTRRLTYATAGHPPPRLKRCQDGSMASLDGDHGLPLGILPGEIYAEVTRQLQTGDQIVFYTDGVTEAESPDGRIFGLGQLDRVLEDCAVGASDLLQATLDALEAFTGNRPPADDQTVLVAKVK
jgi:sigma-B regulation protein RsbU (phosphoserine phosphatase)